MRGWGQMKFSLKLACKHGISSTVMWFEIILGTMIPHEPVVVSVVLMPISCILMSGQGLMCFDNCMWYLIHVVWTCWWTIAKFSVPFWFCWLNIHMGRNQMKFSLKLVCKRGISRTIMWFNLILGAMRPHDPVIWSLLFLCQCHAY